MRKQKRKMDREMELKERKQTKKRKITPKTREKKDKSENQVAKEGKDKS